VFGRVLSITEEESLDLRIVNYIAHVAALEAILAALDYWTNQVVSQTARGSDEIQTFPDRIRANEILLASLRGRTDALRAEAEEVLGVPAGSTTAPTLLNGGTPITPGFEGLERLYLGGKSALVYACEDSLAEGTS
jgi:hypothetical protein